MSSSTALKHGPAGIVALALSCGATSALQAQEQRAGATPAASTREQELQDRIEQLERRVGELESSTVLSEPETRVRRIEVYVDENGVEYTEPQPGTTPRVTYQRERVFRRQTINEKIEEALDDAASRSVGVGVDAAIVIQNVQQSDGPDAPADGNSYELASADLYFTAGLAQNTIFYADIVGLSGTPPLVDGGTVSGALSVPEQLDIEHALVSHCHLDHVAADPHVVAVPA